MIPTPTPIIAALSHCPRDPEAGFTKKHGQTYHGYKGHIAADRRGIVKDYRFSSATPHDSNFIDELTVNEQKLVAADSAPKTLPAWPRAWAGRCVPRGHTWQPRCPHPTTHPRPSPHRAKALPTGP